MTKKWIAVLVGLVFALSLTGIAFAQAKPEKPAPAPAKPAETAKPAEPAKPGEKAAEKKEAPKVTKYRAGGIVKAVDVKGGKITIEQDKVKKERTLKLKVSKKAAKNLGEVKLGDAVNVWVAGNSVTELTKVF